MYVYKSINYRLHERDHKYILYCNCDTECVEKYCMQAGISVCNVTQHSFMYVHPKGTYFISRSNYVKFALNIFQSFLHYLSLTLSLYICCMYKYTCFIIQIQKRDPHICEINIQKKMTTLYTKTEDIYEH